MVEPKIAVVIPARYASQRLPGKPLLEIAGLPMIQHVVQRAQRARGITGVWVATDDERIQRAVEGFGGRAEMTSPNCQSGTDRVAELAHRIDAEFFINVQGDEPLLEPAAIEELAQCLLGGANLATLCRPADPGEALENPNLAKVVLDQKGDALYFSRAPIPYHRDGRSPDALSFVHIGIYGYRRESLFRFAALPPGRLERAERLEQLRALEHGLPFRVLPTPYRSLGVDTPEDLERVRGLLANPPRTLH